MLVWQMGRRGDPYGSMLVDIFLPAFPSSIVAKM